MDLHYFVLQRTFSAKSLCQNVVRRTLFFHVIEFNDKLVKAILHVYYEL